MFQKAARFIFLLIFVPALLFVPVEAQAMQKMAENDLDEIVAGSFSRFTIEELGVNHIAKVDLNVHAEIHADIDSFYSHYAPEVGYSDWDQHWENVTFGTAVDPFRLWHFVLEAEFSDFNDPVNKKLVGLTMGFKNAHGELSGDFHSLTRDDIGGPVNWYRGEVNGGVNSTIDFNGDDPTSGHQFLFQFIRSEDIDGTNFRPITRVDFGGAEFR